MLIISKTFDHSKLCSDLGDGDESVDLVLDDLVDGLLAAGGLFFLVLLEQLVLERVLEFFALLQLIIKK